MIYKHANKGTCSQQTIVDLGEDGVIRSIEILGGCNGNLKGLSSLLAGMPAAEAIQRLKGLTCGPRPTSCPDQIAKALQEAQQRLNA